MTKKKSKKGDKKEPKIEMIDNIELHPNKVIVSVNPRFYNLDVVYSSLYNFLEDNYCKVDGDPNDEILVELKPKKKIKDLEKLGRKFNNELINYTALEIRGLKTEDMRIEIVRRALTSHQSVEEPTESEGIDPEEINVPWEQEMKKR
jgi:His-Xaa-Ser system protein HxsD